MELKWRRVTASVLCLLALTAFAAAGQFDVAINVSAYSVTVTDKNGTSYQQNPLVLGNECGGDFPIGVSDPNAASIEADGTIATTISWNNAYDGEPAPQYAIVVEDCDVWARGYPTTDADDGLGDGIGLQDDYETESFGTHALVVAVSAGGTITLPPCSPYGYAATPNNTLDMHYTVYAYPIRIATTGSTWFGTTGNGSTPGTWNQRILVGQQFTSTFDTGTLQTDWPPSQYPGIYSTLNMGGYSWSFPGGHIYNSYNVASDGSSATFNDLTNQNGVTGNSCTYRFSAPLPLPSALAGGSPAQPGSIVCTASIGGVNVAAVGYLSVDYPVQNQLGSTTVGSTQLLSSNGGIVGTYGGSGTPWGFALYGGQFTLRDGTQKNQGIAFNVIVGVAQNYFTNYTTSSGPVVDQGHYGFAQIITANCTGMGPGQSLPITANGQLDNEFPYVSVPLYPPDTYGWVGCLSAKNGTVNTNLDYWWFADSPGYTPQTGLTSMTLLYNMNAYVLFEPPLPNAGAPPSYVPIYFVNWFEAGTASQNSDGSWAGSDGGQLNGNFSHSKVISQGSTTPSQFPTWTSIFHNVH